MEMIKLKRTKNFKVKVDLKCIKTFNKLKTNTYLEILNIKNMDCTLPPEYLGFSQKTILCSDGNQYWLPYSQLLELEKMDNEPTIFCLNASEEQFEAYNCTYYMDYYNFVNQNFFDISKKLNEFIQTKKCLTNSYGYENKITFLIEFLDQLEKYRYLNLEKIRDTFTCIMKNDGKDL